MKLPRLLGFKTQTPTLDSLAEKEFINKIHQRVRVLDGSRAQWQATHCSAVSNVSGFDNALLIQRGLHWASGGGGGGGGEGDPGCSALCWLLGSL
jgi:hypothetical protein